MNYGLQVMAWGRRRGTLPGSLLEWLFREQSGNSVVNTSNPSTSNNSLNCEIRMFQSTSNWIVSGGLNAASLTDNFAAGPNNSNITATRIQTGGSTGTINYGTTISLPAGHVTISAYLKLNSGGPTVIVNPDAVGPNTTTNWTVTTSWQRFTYTVANVVPVTGVAFFTPANSDLLIYGVQVEAVSSASAYVAPTFDLKFGSKGVGGSDLPTWSGNGTITTTNAQRTVALNDTDTTLTTGTFYCAVQSAGTTPQNYGVILQCENAVGSGVPSRFELQSSVWNAGVASASGGSRKFDPYVGFGGTTGLTKEFPAGNLYDQKWHICCVTCDGTDVHLYIDGILVDSPVAAPVAGTPQSVPFNVFGIGNPNPSVSLNWPGKTGYASVYANSIHTYAQIKQNTAAIAAKLAADGISSGVVGLQTGILAFEGDSITDGIGNAGGVGHPFLTGAWYGLTWIDYGHSGEQIAGLNARAAQLDALIDNTKQYNILVVNIGRNDLDHVSAAAFEAGLLAYWQARVAAGWTLIATTLLPTTDATAQALIPTVNTWIRGNYVSAGCAALADWGGDATILANVANTKYLYDGTHPSALTYTIMEPYLITAINVLASHPTIPSNPAPGTPSPAPASGTSAGGTSVVLTGTGFLPGVRVTFDGTLATITNTTGIPDVTPTSITCTTPAHAAGAVNIVVTNLDGQSATAAGAYTYV